MSARSPAAERKKTYPGGYPLFRVFGFEVKLDLSWLLLALLITWTLAAGLFPVSYPGLPAQAYWWMGIVGAIGIFFSIVFHELSHSLMARRFGLPIHGITLFIFGGMAEMTDEPPSPRAEFLIAVVGPISSLVLAVIFFQIESLAMAAEWSDTVIGVAHYLGMVNVIVAVFNLVPAFPLDGGRMLRSVLWGRNRTLRDATRITSRIGSGFGILLMVLGVLQFVAGAFVGGMWWFLIGAFLNGAARGSYQQTVAREILHGEPVRRFMKADPVTVPASATVQQFVDDYVYRYYLKMFPVMDGSTLLGCITTDGIKAVPKEQWPDTTVRELTDPCSEENTVSPDTDTAQLLSAMIRPDASGRYMVVDNGRLVGMISLKDLRELISLKLDVEKSGR